MKGLDLRGFKKVSASKEFTIMKSPKGHEIKIAHSGLSAHRKAQLDNLPVHLADGGSPSLGVDTDLSQQSQPPQMPDVPPAQPDRAPDATVTPGQTMVQQAQQETLGAQDPNLPESQRQELLKEDQAWAQDLANGHITPKTYQSLFGKKDTLGKFGTMFGLMLSGAGSGLSHQPNAVLGMMNQQIANDLDAQKQSKANAMNFLRLNQAQQLQKAQVGLIGAQTAGTMAEANTKAWALSNMQQNRAALHYLVQQTQKLPIGSPQRQQADAGLAMLNQQVNNENYNIADRAAIATGLVAPQGTQANAEAQFQQSDKALRLSGNTALAQDMESKHYPGLKGQASIPIGGADKEKLDGAFQFQQQLEKFTNWAKNHSGDLRPADFNTGKALAADLQGAYRQATHGGVYKEGEQNFISKIIDEDPTRFFNSIRVLPQLKALSDINISKIDQTAKNLGFQGYNKKQGNSQQPKEGATGTHNNRPVIFKNGKWSYR